MTVVVAPLIALFLALIAVRWCKSRADNLNHAADVIDRFYDAASAIIQNPNIPVEIKLFVQAMSTQVGKPSLARFMFANAMANGKRTHKRSAPASLALAAKIDGMEIDDIKQLGACLALAIMSSALSDPFFAPVLRRGVYLSLLDPCDKPDVTPDRALRVAKVMADRREAWAPDAWNKSDLLQPAI